MRLGHVERAHLAPPVVEVAHHRHTRVHRHPMVEHELAIAGGREPRFVVRREHVAEIRVRRGTCSTDSRHVIGHSSSGAPSDRGRSVEEAIGDRVVRLAARALELTELLRQGRRELVGAHELQLGARAADEPARLRSRSRAAPGRGRGRTTHSPPRSTRGTPTAGTTGRATGIRPRGSPTTPRR